MTPEQVAVLADEASPAFFAASFQLALGALRDTVAIQARLGTGGGFGAQHCRYPDGARVVCTTVAAMSYGRIKRQTAVQAWDS